MLAIHSYFSHGKKKWFDFELITAAISAVIWKSYNGPIHLFTNQQGYDELKEFKITTLYDDIKIVDAPKLDPNTFWAASKIYGIKSLRCPFVSIDMDAVVWNKINGLDNQIDIRESPVIALHKEPLKWNVYKTNKRLFSKYFNDIDFDWKIKPANTGVTIFREQEIKDIYVDVSIKFMELYQRDHPRPVPKRLGSQMVFAEQRLLSMICQLQKRPIKYLFNLDESRLHIPVNNIITHLWNMKGSYERDKKLREPYNRALKIILKHFGFEFDNSIYNTEPTRHRLYPGIRVLKGSGIVKDINLPFVVERLLEAGDRFYRGENFFPNVGECCLKRGRKKYQLYVDEKKG